MAPLDPTGTARYFVHYTNGGDLHTQEFRSGGPASPADMMAWLIVLWEAASGILRTTVIESVDFAASGSHVSTPVSMPDFVGQTYGSGTGDNIGRTQYINAIGRSGGGRRVRVAFFGTNVNDETFRFNAGENAQVDAIITALEGNSVDLVAIDGIEPIWKSYMNAGFNAHWQRAARS